METKASFTFAEIKSALQRNGLSARTQAEILDTLITNPLTQAPVRKALPGSLRGEYPAVGAVERQDSGTCLVGPDKWVGMSDAEIVRACENER